MRNLLQARSARKAQTPAFTAAPQASNVRGISITDTGTGARVGVLLAGAADSGTNVESLSLQVHIEYGDRRQKDIDVLMRDALHEALRVIQHELNDREKKAPDKDVFFAARHLDAILCTVTVAVPHFAQKRHFPPVSVDTEVEICVVVQ